MQRYGEAVRLRRKHLTIHLYGAEDANEPRHGIACKEGNQCGIPTGIWNSNPVVKPDVKCDKENLPGGGTDSGVSDCFYQYKPLNYDGGNSNAYFGYKTLADFFRRFDCNSSARKALRTTLPPMATRRIRAPAGLGSTWIWRAAAPKRPSPWTGPFPPGKWATRLSSAALTTCPGMLRC